MAISGTAGIIMAASAAAGTGYAVYAGERGAKMQRQAMRKQAAAQKVAETRALSAERRNMLESNRARGKKADVASLLTDAQNAGGNPTMLTGASGTSTMLGQ
jgi:4-diphosphocytidyl-2C-methyl-D-erythritol kinase